MKMNVAREVAAVERLSVPQLLGRYAEAFGEMTNTKNKAWLVKRIAWRLQANVEGDLTERARRRAAELANDANVRLTPPFASKPVTPTPMRIVTLESDNRLPPVGTVLTRPYKRRVLQVRVLEDGFEFEGEVYTSLSAVAKAATGSHCNGFHFFRLAKKGGAA